MRGDGPGLTLVLLYLGLPLALLAVALLAGSLIAVRWDSRLTRREAALAHLVVTTTRSLPDAGALVSAGLVVGCCVGCIDHSRRFAGRLRRLLGGELSSWTRSLARSRREAVVRMLEEAARLGATHVVGVRLEASGLLAVEQQRRGITPIEFVAWGTALRRG